VTLITRKAGREQRNFLLMAEAPTTRRVPSSRKKKGETTIVSDPRERKRKVVFYVAREGKQGGHVCVILFVKREKGERRNTGGRGKKRENAEHLSISLREGERQGGRRKSTRFFPYHGMT